MRRSRNFLQVLSGLGIGLVIVVAVLNAPRLYFQHHSDAVQRDFLLHNDHAAFLSDCRTFMRQHPQDERGTYLSGADPRLPTRLRQLDSNYVSLTNDEMEFTCGGGLTYEYYVTAFARGAKEGGQVRIIPGLWYRRGTINDH